MQELELFVLSVVFILSMGRSAKVCRSVSYEKVKKVKKGQVWRQSGSHMIRQEQKAARRDDSTISSPKIEPESNSNRKALFK